MTPSTLRTEELIRRLDRRAEAAEGEGRAWEAAACGACALYLQALERIARLQVAAGGAEALRPQAQAQAQRRRPSPPERPAKARRP